MKHERNTVPSIIGFLVLQKKKYWFPFSEISLGPWTVRELEGNSEAPALQV